MDKYQVIGLLGEGSFGRVYKAKELATNTFVALKIICKRGRCSKELKGLRRECEIQRHLHHPNIIQMLDSFESDNEIYVITEFAHKELNTLLGKKGVLPEETVQIIVWDLVSALYYLHSHRVLHRDLKPQNILLDTKNRAKLCDFGFARNMSTGTHVLTSIKGTPLYMAPELIEEQPYDHNADLWSLGCIIYELLEGAPPFRTTSILHLIKLIRHEQIQWPTMVSDHCITFLKGLLQKNPLKRMTWPEILNHPFVKGHIIVSEDSPEMPLTRPMSANTLEVKEQQKRNHTSNRSAKFPSVRNCSPKSEEYSSKKHVTIPSKTVVNPRDNQDLENNNPPANVDNLEEFRGKNVETEGSKMSLEIQKSGENNVYEENRASGLKKNQPFGEAKLKYEVGRIDCVENQYPLVNEEWLVFLKKTIKELKSGEISSFVEPTMIDIIMSPLLNPSSNSAVVCLVAKLYCLPFATGITDPSVLSSLKVLYLDINLIPNLLYSVQLLFQKKSNTPVLNTPPPGEASTKNVTDLTVDDFNCLEHVFLAINHFVHWNKEYVEQFCDAIESLEIHNILKVLLLCTKRKLRIVLDLLSSLTQLLRIFPERHETVDKILQADLKTSEVKAVNFVELLRHVNPMLRERTCYFLLVLGNAATETLASLWNDVVQETLEALMFDSINTVRIAAERTCNSLNEKEFYSKD